MPALVQAQFTFTTNSGTVTITGYTGPGGDLFIPDRIHDLPVTGIGAGAFRSCTSVTSVTIPNSVVSIGNEAFYWCINLTNVTIPSSVTSIGTAAFRACSSLGAITVATNNPAYSSVGGVLFNQRQTTLLQYPVGKADSDYSIPGTVTGIGDQAFYNCYRLTGVTIPSSVNSIGSEAFWACRGLTAVTLPDSVTSLGSGAFNLCIGLTRVTIGSGLTRIGPYTFGSCSSLRDLTIGNSVTNIGAYAFQGCKGLTSLKISASVTSIGARAFEHCTGLTDLTIPDRVTRIESEAFHWCTGVTRVTLGTNVTDIGDDAFAYCTSLASITIPNSVTNIGAEAFWWCFALTSVTIPDSVTRIERNTFYCCTGLTNVTIPEGVTSIGDHAFEGCTNLSSILIPNRVTNVGDYAFYSCPNLTGVYFKGNAPSVGADVFRGDSNAIVYYLPRTTGWGPTFCGCRTALWITHLGAGVGQTTFEKGAYSGLFYERRGVSQQTCGSFTLNMTARGRFSARLQCVGARYSLSGFFDANGQARATIARRNASALNVGLQREGADRMSGTVNDGTSTADLYLDRAGFDGKATTAPQLGQYTIVIPGSPTNAAEPGGDGYGTISVDKAGRVRLAGSLADGAKVSQVVPLSRDGVWPLYGSLYGGQGLIIGWVTFTDTPMEDLSGWVAWLKSSEAKSKCCQGGFTMETTAWGSRYTRPSAGGKVLDVSEAQVVLTGGNLVQGVTNYIVVEPNNRVTNLSGNKFSLRWSASSGTFKGRVADPTLPKPITFGGVVLQKRQVASGFFLGTDQSGPARISAKPQ